MSKTKKSVMEQVKEFIASNPKFTIKELRGAMPNVDVGQLNTSVWKLTNIYKKIRRVGEGQYELTDVNKTEQPAVEPQPAKAKPKAKRRAQTVTMTDRVAVAERDNRYLKERIEDLTYRMTKLNVQYEDALAVIRYLENKLFIAIQFNAKNNGNT